MSPLDHYAHRAAIRARRLRAIEQRMHAAQPAAMAVSPIRPDADPVDAERDEPVEVTAC